MSNKNRFDPILHHANSQQEELAQRLSAALQQKRSAEEQLAQLLTYRQEYGSRQLSGESVSVHNLHNQQLFINQLNKAIEQQQAQIEKIRRHVEQQQLFWQQSKTRCDAIGDLIEKQANSLKKREHYREQKESDEFGNRRNLPRPGND